MGVNLSIKNVPTEQVERLKARAKRNHRSLQGELRAMVDDATGTARRRKSIDEVLAELRALDLNTPAESAAWIRQDRER